MGVTRIKWTELVKKELWLIGYPVLAVSGSNPTINKTLVKKCLGCVISIEKKRAATLKNT